MPVWGTKTARALYSPFSSCSELPLAPPPSLRIAIGEQGQLDFELTDEGIGELLIAPGFADLTIGLGGVLGVDGSREVVELGGGLTQLAWPAL